MKVVFYTDPSSSHLTNYGLRKEDLWPHIREFSDRAIEHTTATLARLHQVGNV